MEMSLRSHFDIKFFLKMKKFMRKCQPDHFFGNKKILDRLQNTILSTKC